MTMALRVSSMVAGMVSRNSCVTGRWVRAERPRSPWSTLPNQETYCTGRGRSKPRLERIISTSSFVASIPATSRAGSPGTRWRRRKIMTETPKRIGVMYSRRRRM